MKNSQSETNLVINQPDLEIESESQIKFSNQNKKKTNFQTKSLGKSKSKSKTFHIHPQKKPQPLKLQKVSKPYHLNDEPIHTCTAQNSDYSRESLDIDLNLNLHCADINDQKIIPYTCIDVDKETSSTITLKPNKHKKLIAVSDSSFSSSSVSSRSSESTQSSNNLQSNSRSTKKEKVHQKEYLSKSTATKFDEKILIKLNQENELLQRKNESAELRRTSSARSLRSTGRNKFSLGLSLHQGGSNTGSNTPPICKTFPNSKVGSQTGLNRAKSFGIDSIYTDGGLIDYNKLNQLNIEKLLIMDSNNQNSSNKQNQNASANANTTNFTNDPYFSSINNSYTNTSSVSSANNVTSKASSFFGFWRGSSNNSEQDNSGGKYTSIAADTPVDEKDDFFGSNYEPVGACDFSTSMANEQNKIDSSTHARSRNGSDRDQVGSNGLNGPTPAQLKDLQASHIPVELKGGNMGVINITTGLHNGHSGTASPNLQKSGAATPTSLSGFSSLFSMNSTLTGSNNNINPASSNNTNSNIPLSKNNSTGNSNLSSFTSTTASMANSLLKRSNSQNRPAGHHQPLSNQDSFGQRTRSAALGHGRHQHHFSSSNNSNNLTNNNNEVLRQQDAQAIQWSIWSKALNDFESFSKKNPKNLSTLVYNGIPHHFRAMAWQLLSGAHKSAFKEKYITLLKQDSPNEKLINRDISRTYPEHPNFKKDGPGRDCLFNVMKAYSLVDPEVGYCQGLCFIVGLLLMHVPEEDAFAIFCEMMLNRKFGLRDLYKPGMHQLGLNIFLLQGLLQELAPDLHSHFIAQGLEASSFSSSWFLTIFTTTFTIKCCSRIIDCLLLDGPEIVFKVALAVLLAEKDKLKTLDMEHILDYLNKQAPKMYDNDPSLLIQKSQQYKIDLKDRKIRRWEKEYTEKKNKEAEEQVEVRRLRDENRELRERVEALDKENGSLARQLASLKINHALQQEKELIIKKELNTVRRHAKKMSGGNAEETGKHAILGNSQSSPGVDNITQHQSDMKVPGTHGTDSNGMNTPNHTLNQSFSSESGPPHLTQSANLYSDEFVLQLQQELIASRLKEATLAESIKDLEARCETAEKKNAENSKDKQLLQLQEELVKSKQRFAESQATVTALRSRLDNLQQAWSNAISKITNAGESTNGHGRIGIIDTNEHSLTREAYLERELMSIRLLEAKSLADNRDQNEKILELEHWCERLNKQIASNEDERAELRFRVLKYEKAELNREEYSGLECSSTRRSSSSKGLSRNVSNSDDKYDKGTKDEKNNQTAQQTTESDETTHINRVKALRQKTSKSSRNTSPVTVPNVPEILPLSVSSLPTEVTPTVTGKKNSQSYLEQKIVVGKNDDGDVETNGNLGESRI